MTASTSTQPTTPRGEKKRPALTWRVVDIVVASVIGVASGIIFFAWNQIYQPITAPLEAALPGLQALLYAVWLFPAVLAGLIIRKPGAAIYAEVIAAVVSALLGAQWGGFLTIEAGIVQGLGAEVIFLLFFYRKWNLPVALLAGAASGLAMGINDAILWYAGSTPSFFVTYIISATVSGVVIAGLLSWLIARGLARTGVLNRFASGQEVSELV